MRKSTRLNDMMIFLNDKSFFNLKDIMQEWVQLSYNKN